MAGQLKFVENAEVVKLVDTLDSKSSGFTAVPVRFRLSVPHSLEYLIPCYEVTIADIRDSWKDCPFFCFYSGIHVKR